MPRLSLLRPISSLGASASRCRTPHTGQRLYNGSDSTRRSYVFSSPHFAAIAGGGASCRPVLAAQMGYYLDYLDRIGVIFAVLCRTWFTLFLSMRRDGRILGQMRREEESPRGGAAALPRGVSRSYYAAGRPALGSWLTRWRPRVGHNVLNRRLSPVPCFMGLYLRSFAGSARSGG